MRHSKDSRSALKVHVHIRVHKTIFLDVLFMSFNIIRKIKN